MGKCPICNAVKGKRFCLLKNTLICSQCCANTRVEELCLNCMFYQKPQRDYHEVPTYSTSDMSNNTLLNSYGFIIEKSLSDYDIKNSNQISDSDAIRILELLIDKYYFQDLKLNGEEELVINGFNYLENVINDDLKDVAVEKIVKVLSVIRFVAKRRTNIGKEYMSIIHKYTKTNY